MMPLTATRYRSGPVVWAANIGATCLVLFLFQQMLWLVVPFILALIIYYLLLPLKTRLVLMGMTHSGAASWVSVLALILLVFAAAFGISPLLTELANWQSEATRYVQGGVKLLAATLKHLESRFNLVADAHLSRVFGELVREYSSRFAERYLPAAAMTIATWSPSLILAPFLAFFMLRDGWRFRKFLIRGVPNAYFERSLLLMDQVDRTARLYFVGLMQLTLLDTCCLALGLWYIGMSSPLLLGLVTAVLAWVPYIGSIIGCLLVVLVAATDFPGNPGVAYAAVGLFVLVRLLDDFVFMPMTVGKSLNMHPLLTVLMIFVGGAVAGTPGLMLVLPVLGVVMVLGETLGALLTDQRLAARHAHEKALRLREVTRDLKLD